MAPELISLSESERNALEEFRSSHETKVLTIFFSDLVDSTKLQVEHGNLTAARLVQHHYSLMRTILKNFDGKEISTAGDSMLIVFLAPADAIKFALTAQQAMRRAQEREPLLPAMRCGVHQGQVVVQLDVDPTEINDICGVQVSTAARIMSLGAGNQILMSRAVFDDARTVLAHDQLTGFGEIHWISHGNYQFKGIPEECEVCEVGEVSFAPLSVPEDSGKAWSVNTPPHAQQTRPTRASSRSRIIGWLVLMFSLVSIVVLTISAVNYQAVWFQPPLDSQRDEEIATDPIARLNQIETQLTNLAGIDDDLKAMESLDQDYRKATNVIFGGEPSQVRSDALKFLARLRTSDLKKEERALVAKADAMASSLFSIYPEEIYPPIRQLAEQLSARQAALRREKNRLQLKP